MLNDLFEFGLSIPYLFLYKTKILVYFFIYLASNENKYNTFN